MGYPKPHTLLNLDLKLINTASLTLRKSLRQQKGFSGMWHSLQRGSNQSTSKYPLDQLDWLYTLRSN